MVFQYASLVFSTPGPILGPQDLDLGSGWPGDLFGAKKGARKTRFCGGNGPPWGLGGSVRGEWIVGYPGGLWAGPFPPKPCQKIVLQGFARFSFFFMGPGNPWWALAIQWMMPVGDARG